MWGPVTLFGLYFQITHQVFSHCTQLFCLFIKNKEESSHPALKMYNPVVFLGSVLETEVVPNIFYQPFFCFVFCSSSLVFLCQKRVVIILFSR